MKLYVIFEFEFAAQNQKSSKIVNFIIQHQLSTMSKSMKNGLSKAKKIVKQSNKPTHNHSNLRETNQQGPPIRQHLYESAQDVRKRLARQALSKIENKKAPQQDDFFIVEKEQIKNIEQQNDLITQQLRRQHLRKQNKLYEDIQSSFARGGLGQPIEYKGHTLCITAFEINKQHIYSCSKDRSIIKWDRETKQKQFISLGKDINHHRSDILSLSLHSNGNVLATAGDDCQIKLWDTRTCSLIDTLRGHKNTINGVKFGHQSNNLCSVSADLTFKQWDFSQRGLIQTFYQHTAQVLDIDCFNANDFISSGYDRQVISWKTEKETKVIFKGHDYAIDRVRSINLQRFVTACQDGSVYLWHSKKSKPVFKLPRAHLKGWISALDTIKQSNIFATGGIDRVVKIWGIEGDNTGLKCLREVVVDGIVTDLKITPELLAVTECDQLRLGRWVTDKCRNKIKVFPILE